MLKRARGAFDDADIQLDRYINKWYSTASDESFNNMKSELLKLAEEYNELTEKVEK